MKIALAQINTTVGDISGNEAKILAAYERGVMAGADIIVLPELALTGYPPRDLLHRKDFISRNLAALDRRDFLRVSAAAAALGVGNATFHRAAASAAVRAGAGPRGTPRDRPGRRAR